MLVITVGGNEVFDEETQSFSIDGGYRLELEHSLVSLSKWESEFEKPFLGEEEKTSEEALAYVKAMALHEVPEEIFLRLTEENFDAIQNYITAQMTATWFSDQPKPPRVREEVITSELIYYWMIGFQIPFEAETWHLNRLFTLIRICNVKAAKPEKMSRAEVMARNRELNAQRKKQLGTKG